MKKTLIAFIRLYQKNISPAFPARCRFRPTCSQYACEAINRYGAVRGTWLAAKRLSRCHPFYHGDIYDPVP